MKRQKKSHDFLPVFGGRAVLVGIPPIMGKVYSCEVMVEQFKKNGMNVQEITIPKENPLEGVDKTPLDEYLDEVSDEYYIPEKDDYTWWWHNYFKKRQRTIKDTEEGICRDYQE